MLEQFEAQDRVDYLARHGSAKDFAKAVEGYTEAIKRARKLRAIRHLEGHAVL
jgi:hypothetical protein